jgi:hypothetical protein
LLHIDGIHTYEAVRHDFECWLPKVRPGGIILLHDTSVVADNFGVWRVWEELEKIFPAFAFQHSSGLGVILKHGDAPADGIAAWLFGEQPVDGEAIRTYYELCADRLELRRRLREEQTPESRGMHLQVFWRFAGQEFSEQQSIRLYSEFSKNENTVRIALPASSEPMVELRVDFAGQLLAEIACLRLMDKNDTEIWRWKAREDSLRAAGIRIVMQDDVAIMHVARGGGAILLPVDAAALCVLADGGTLEIRSSGLSVDECLGRLFSQSGSGYGELREERRSGEEALHSAREPIAGRDALVERLTAGLAHAEGLAIEHLQRVREYDRALAQAQDLVATRDKEIQRLTAALAHAERLAVERHQQLLEYDRALAHAQGLAVERQQLLQERDQEIAGQRAGASALQNALRERELECDRLALRLEEIQKALQ